MLISPERLVELGVAPKLTLHVGAHEAEEQGMYDQLGWEVIWVEAIPEKAESIRLRGLPVIEAAAYHTNTTLTFHQSNLPASSSIYEFDKHLEKYGGIIMVKEYEVEARTIDSFNINFDFLVLDIQGAELDALKGAENSLENVNWIYSEVSYEELYRGGVLESELTAWLAERNFYKVEEKLTKFGWGDALYKKAPDKYLI